MEDIDKERQAGQAGGQGGHVPRSVQRMHEWMQDMEGIRRRRGSVRPPQTSKGQVGPGHGHSHRPLKDMDMDMECILRPWRCWHSP